MVADMIGKKRVEMERKQVTFYFDINNKDSWFLSLSLKYDHSGFHYNL